MTLRHVSAHNIYLCSALFLGKSQFPAYNHVSVIGYTKNFPRYFLQVNKMVKLAMPLTNGSETRGF